MTRISHLHTKDPDGDPIRIPLGREVSLVNPGMWPEFIGFRLILEEVVGTGGKYALLRVKEFPFNHERRVFLAETVTTAMPELPPAMLDVDQPAVMWGSLVTLRSGKQIVVTHPEVTPLQGIKGVPIGMKSPVEVNLDEIVHIRHPQELTKVA
ncbi:hypothetical protein [Vreelandella massiliensis]|uniref:hypothetical protein n=1 Tax=Vreelandella massiliensis TaxID=1816686 RepID=UPI00096AC79B|nr:hypothetical protein [Halomonas massiliensis]